MESTEEDESIYRSEAVETYSGANDFEHHFFPFQYKTGAIKGVLALLLISAIGWFFFGTIPIEVQGVAVVMNQGGLSTIESSVNGIVKELKFQMGDVVQQGDLIAVLYNREMELHQTMINERLEHVQKRISELEKEIKREREAKEKELVQGIHGVKYKMQILETEIAALRDEVAKKEELTRLGLLDSDNLQETKDLLWDKEIDVEKAKAALLQFHFLLKKRDREEEIQALKHEQLDVEQAKKRVDIQLSHQKIYSPFNGFLTEWLIQPNQVIVEGNSIATVELGGEERENKVFYGYLPLEEGRKLKINDEVMIEIKGVKSGEYGAILGNIASISPYAITPENLSRHINHNVALNHYVLQDRDAVVEVLIKPQLDPSTISGYRWTSQKGAPIQLSSGTLCSFKGVVDDVHPYLFIIPVWWIKKNIHPFL